jgi:hypothetical protein
MKEAKKVLKYKDLATDIQCMWNIKAMVTQVVRGGTGSISKSFIKYLTNIPGRKTSRNYIKQPYRSLRTYF